MNTPSSREEDLFHRALAVPAGERAAFLDRTCAGDAALRAQVEKLLRFHDDPSSLLEQPAAELAATQLQAAPRDEEKPGHCIGRYKLLQLIGEGGCGSVYMAEQQEPVRRRVALKVIKLGMDTKAVIARFDAERQALALMDHPHIAKVLDAGATETGRPFFVMELVRGVPITKYCDENNLPMAARLALFNHVCHALQHAHQKGIIHRDVKPSNILVTIHDGEPMPKVIDFGIAKATQGRLTEQTLFTALEQFIGTPAYMSPEQAEMSALDVDTRSDIYSLGVLLYELLTGHPPFDPKSFLSAGLDEMRRIIREVEPPRPSTRLSTLTDADRSTVARLRGAVPAQLSTQLSGDLDWIVMKALDKNRTRRYESASAFAADIQRFLRNEPVIARPPSTTYLLQKLVRRHKVAVAATSAIAAALVIGLGVATWSFLQERAARQRAVAAEQEQANLRQLAEAARQREAVERTRAEASAKKAQTEAAKSEQAFRFMTGMLQGVGPSVAAGRDTTLLKEILEKTAKRLETDLKDKPEVGAAIRAALGTVYMDLGDYARAEALLRESLAQVEAVQGRTGEEAAGVIATLAAARAIQGHGPEAEKLAREALALARALPPEKAKPIAQANFVLGMTLQLQGKLPEAEAALRETLARARVQRDHEELPPDMVLALLGSTLQKQQRLGEAEPVLREALALVEKRLDADHPFVSQAKMALSNVLLLQGKFAEAEANFEDGFARLKKVLGPEHPNIAMLLTNRGVLALGQRKLPEAVTRLREAIAQQTKTLGADHPQIAIARGLLSEALQAQGRKEDATTVLQEAHTAQGPRFTSEEQARADARVTAGMNALRAGKWAEAETELRAALPVVEQANGPRHQVTLRLRNMLADAVYRLQRTAEAESLLTDVVRDTREAFGPKSAFVASALIQLGRAQFTQDKLAETEVTVREALEIHKLQTSDGQNPAVASATLLLAMIRARRGDLPEATALAETMGRFARAFPESDAALNPLVNEANSLKAKGEAAQEEAVLRVALSFVRSRDNNESVSVAQILNLLASTLHRAGKFAEAEAVARESAAQRRKLLPASSWNIANTESKIGQALLAQKKFTEAEPILLASFAEQQRLKPDGPPATLVSWQRALRDNAQQLVLLYEAIGQTAKTAEWKATAERVGPPAAASP